MTGSHDAAVFVEHPRSERRSARPHTNSESASFAVDPDEVRRAGDEFTFLWRSLGIGIGVSHLRETAAGLHGELYIESTVGGHLHWAGHNLSSTSAREQLVGKLSKVATEVDWRRLLERVCRETAEKFRAGEPVVVLEPALTAPAAPYLVEQLLPAGETAIIFGDGGSGKSLLALAVAVAVVTGTTLPAGLRPHEHANVLYLDWESTQAVHAERLSGLLIGLGLKQPAGVFYRPMARALADDITRLRAEVSRRNVGLVIVDSFGPACGAEPEGADSAIRLMNAVRTFAPATRLVIAHVSKMGAEQRSGPARPFGSVYVQNLARSVWEVRRPNEDAEGDVMPLALFHRKVNQGRRFAPIGLQFEFQNGAIRIQAQDLADEPELAAHASLSYRLLQMLRSGAQTVEALAEAVDTTPNTVRATLSRLRTKGKVVSLDDFKGGRGNAGRWGLPRGS